MKKRLYDFSIANAIIVLCAYAVMLSVATYSIFEGGGFHWLGFVVSVLLLLSLAMVIWFFVFLAVVVTDQGISHGRLMIGKKNVRWSIEDNRRFRQTEIIIRDRNINYDKLDQKAARRKLIIIQYFPKYESFLKEYCAWDAGKGENRGE